MKSTLINKKSEGNLTKTLTKCFGHYEVLTVEGSGENRKSYGGTYFTNKRLAEKSFRKPF